jgi:tetraacyldisaccharide 4'-kinase
MSQTQAQRHARWQAEALERGWPAQRRRPLATLYGLLVLLRRLAYQSGLLRTRRLPVPVVVGGNVVVGGAGKTPTVLALINHLRQRGWHPGVVSRGHGRLAPGIMEVGPQTQASQGGDEPVLIHRRGCVPVFVGKDRAAAGQALLQAHQNVDLLLCDDGLQHLALERDVSVVVFDERGVGNGWLLPAGLLREPWPPGMAGRLPDLLLQQQRDGMPPPEIPRPPGVPGFVARRRLAKTAVGQDGQQLPLSQLAGIPFTAVAGLAQPQRFFDMLRAQGCQAMTEIALPDHAPAQAYAPALRQSLPVVCTEKDLPKLAEQWRKGDPPVWAVPLELDVDSAFFDALDARLPSPPPG